MGHRSLKRDQEQLAMKLAQHLKERGETLDMTWYEGYVLRRHNVT